MELRINPAAGNIHRCTGRSLAAKVGVHHPTAAAYRNTAIASTETANRAAATRALTTVRVRSWDSR